MARFNNISDDQVITPAVEPQAPARVEILAVNTETLVNQTVQVAKSATMNFDKQLIIAMLEEALRQKDAYQQQNRSTIKATIKLGIMAATTMPKLFTYHEVRALVLLLCGAIDFGMAQTNKSAAQEENLFELKMAVLDLREAVTPQISDTEPDEAVDLRKKYDPAC